MIQSYEPAAPITDRMLSLAGELLDECAGSERGKGGMSSHVFDAIFDETRRRRPEIMNRFEMFAIMDWLLSRYGLAEILDFVESVSPDEDEKSPKATRR
jgi:hypothetical protein